MRKPRPLSPSPPLPRTRGRGPHAQADTPLSSAATGGALPARDVRSATKVCDVRRKTPMKAVYIEKLGGPDVLHYGDQPDPVPAPGEVVVDVHAASVNGADWKVRAGDYKQTTFPFALGRDFSGAIGAVGAGVDDL